MQNNITFSPGYASISGGPRNNTSIQLKDVIDSNSYKSIQQKNQGFAPFNPYTSNIPLGRQVTFGQDNRTSQPLRITFNNNSTNSYTLPPTIFTNINQSNTNNSALTIINSNPPLPIQRLQAPSPSSGNNNPQFIDNSSSFVNPPSLYNTNKKIEFQRKEVFPGQKLKEVSVMKNQVNTFQIDTNQFKNVKQSQFSGCFQCFSPVTYDTKIKKGFCR